MTLDEVQVSLNTLKTQLKNNLQNRGVTVQDTDGLTTLSNKILNISNTIPVTITLTSDATTLDSSNNFTAHLEAKVLDYGNNPVQNVTIQFLKDSSSLSQSLTNN
jgi:outer membrane lipopolysaccharide assembly protein LptE/RlpB